MRLFYLVIFLKIGLFTNTLEAQERTIRPDKPNVLFIAVDDLRPELGCYGKQEIKSPNIDRLAESGIVFTNAYVNYPVCGPSRASLLSGIYPAAKRFTVWNCAQDNDVPGVVSLPMHFKNNDYKTISLGKVYNNFDDGQGSWDVNWRPKTTTTPWDYQSVKGIQIYNERNKDRFNGTGTVERNKLPQRGPAFEHPDVPDYAYNDGRIAIKAIEELQELKNSTEPFFLAVGFHKPHLPFNAPKKYWDIYDHKKIKIPDNNHLPKRAPEAAGLFNFYELRAYYGIPQEGPLPDSTSINLIHGYYSCVSYVDAQVGKVLDALKDYGMLDNTIVVLWGDHGWLLDEHGLWCKHNNFELAAHIPFIVKVPWKQQGKETKSLVETVDIYPTLCELAGLSLPFHLQGESFTSLLEHPERPFKDAIFYRHNNAETVLTQSYTYTEWIDENNGNGFARMLYDRQNDPEENVNIAELPENKELVTTLSKRIDDHIKKINSVPLCPNRSKDSSGDGK